VVPIPCPALFSAKRTFQPLSTPTLAVLPEGVHAFPSHASLYRCPALASQAYRKEEEETDELLLYDEECAELDPAYLPRRLLTDFSIYNAEVGGWGGWGWGDMGGEGEG
jgi:hypothetical protein